MKRNSRQKGRRPHRQAESASPLKGVLLGTLAYFAVKVLYSEIPQLRRYLKIGAM